MPIEYEIKYLLIREEVDLTQAVEVREIAQYYLVQQRSRTIRLRTFIREQKPCYELTLKFKGSQGNPEFNIPLSSPQGAELLQVIQQQKTVYKIEKKRYLFPALELQTPHLFWEVDFFQDPLSFLTVAELEYPGPTLPQGLSQCPSWYQNTQEHWPHDVTKDPDFLNASLSRLRGSSLEKFRKKVKSLLF